MNPTRLLLLLACWIINLYHLSIQLAIAKHYVLSHSPRLAAPASCQQDANAAPIVTSLCLKHYLISRKLQSTFSFLLPHSLEISKVKFFEVFCLALRILLLNILVLQRHLLEPISSLRFTIMTLLVISTLNVPCLQLVIP